MAFQTFPSLYHLVRHYNQFSFNTTGALSDKTVVSHYEILMFLSLFFPNSHRKIFLLWALITQKMLMVSAGLLRKYLIVPVLSTFCFVFSTFLILFVTICFQNCSTHLFDKYDQNTTKHPLTTYCAFFPNSRGKRNLQFIFTWRNIFSQPKNI